jgi:hypothetical protein
MNLLRRLPLPRLVLVCLAVVVLGTGVAVASSIGSGPTPPPASLADAIHSALSAAPVGGVSASITLTNSLLTSGSAPSGTPLLSGGSGRVWISADGQVRLELQADSGDTEIYYSKGVLSYYDPRNGGTLYNLTLPDHPGHSGGSDSDAHAPPSVSDIQQAIAHLMTHATVSGAIPGDVAGQPTYEVRVTPNRDAGLFGGAAVWWDANHGVPLQFAVYAANDASPVLQLSATSVSYGPIDASVFTPPIAAKTDNVDLTPPAGVSHASGTGAPATLPFTPSAPASLDGQTLTSKRVVQAHGHAAQLLFYGHGLGGIAVLERQADAAPAPPNDGSGTDDGSSNSLPTVSINGVSATEIPTALGTLLSFTRGGVSYTVVGSIPTADAVRAAEGL